MVFDHRDYFEIPAGTIINDVPFYFMGKDKPPLLVDYQTSSDGAFFSMDAQKVLKK